MASAQHWPPLVVTAALISACGAKPPRVVAPPSAASISKKQPGGDSQDPHEAALQRLLTEPNRSHQDRFRTLRVMLPDRKNWRRVRFYGHPTRANFRYGDDHHAVAVISYEKARSGDSPSQCLEQMIGRARPLADRFSFAIGAIDHTVSEHPLGTERFGRPVRERRRSRSSPMAIASLGGEFETLFNTDAYRAAVAAYSSWPGTCLVQGFAVRIGSDADLAQAVVERWLTHSAPRLRWSVRLRATPKFANR